MNIEFKFFDIQISKSNKSDNKNLFYPFIHYTGLFIYQVIYSYQILTTYFEA